MTIIDKLNYLQDTKDAIKSAIINKGVPISDADTFRSYADKINLISGEPLNYSIDPFEYSNGLFINIDGKTRDPYKKRSSMDIQNLASSENIYFYRSQSTASDIASDHFIFRGTNGWYIRDASGPFLTISSKISIETVFSISEKREANFVSYFIGIIESGGYNLCFYTDPDGLDYIRTYIYSNGAYKYFDCLVNIELNKIHYAATVFDGTSIKIWFNPLSSAPNTTLDYSGLIENSSNAPVCLGYNGSSAGAAHGNEFKGNIYSAKIWNRPVSDSLIYNSYLLQKERFNF